MKPVKLPINKRDLIIIIVAVIAFYCGLSYAVIFSSFKKQKTIYQQVSKESEDLKKQNQGLSQDLAELTKKFSALQQEFKNVSLDRDNLFKQAKNMLSDISRLKDLEASVEKTAKEKDGLSKQLQDVIKEKQEVITQNLNLKQMIRDLDLARDKLVAENRRLEDALAIERDTSKMNKIEQQSVQLQKDKSQVLDTLKKTQAELSKERADANKLKNELTRKDKALQELGVKLKEADKKYAEALKANRALELRINYAPKKFSELARQNKALIRETAATHYNLGVFYTKNKDYSRAVAEFEKTIELVPDDAYAHFNLGYIYAEQIVNRQKAVEHFRAYLRYAKKNDKDIDWVKKYILTWQTWQGKEPLE